MKRVRRRRKYEELIFRVLMWVSTLAVMGGAVGILAAIAIKGFPVMTWEMLTKPPSGGYYLGGGGGILNAIAGTAIIAFGATVIASLAALPVVIYIHTYARNRAWVETVRFALDLLWGIPSIVYGVFGFLLMMFLGVRASVMAGIITVAMLEFPIVVRGMDEIVRLVPKGLSEVSLSLGATKIETAFKVVLKQAAPGFLTPVLIAFGRGVGDAASVLFTAGFSDKVPTSLSDPAATLPVSIFVQLTMPYPEVQRRAYASALTLTLIILFVSIVSKWLMRNTSLNRVTE